MSARPIDVRELMAAAHEPVPADEVRRVFDDARTIAIRALVDTSEHPVATLARSRFQGASAERMAALVEPLTPVDAHAAIEALSRHGLVDPEQAQLAHLRIDLRPPIRSENEIGRATRKRPRPWPKESKTP